jgi:hypothetical protein
VPSIHLSNGTFALKGHCVTLPQDITEISNKLPLRKEAVVVFIRCIGNKDTSAVYPKSLRVNKPNVLEALLWLKKHNPHYADITINELNLDWMNGQNEANIGTQASIFKTKDTQRYKINATEEEVVSKIHKPFENNDLSNDSCDMDIGCMHANEINTLPTGMDTEIMKSFVEIAKKMGQLSEIMKFPPIDHDSPIRYVFSYTRYSNFKCTWSEYHYLSHDIQKSNNMYHLTSIHRRKQIQHGQCGRVVRRHSK